MDMGTDISTRSRIEVCSFWAGIRGWGLLRSRQPFCRGRSAFVAGFALVGLNNAAQATIGSDDATSVTLPLAQFPIDNDTDTAPAPPVVLAQAAPAAGGGAGGAAPAAGGAAPAAGANPGGAGNAAPGTGGNVNPGLPTLGSDQDNPYGVSTSGVAPATANQPAWVIGGQVSDSEIATDNVGHSHNNHQSDLISQLSAGFTVSADTPRLEGTFGYTGNYRTALSHSGQDRFSQFGLLRAHTTLVPDYFTVDLFGNATELDRLGVGISNNALLTNTETTQIYSLGVSPDVKSRFGQIGFVDLNYYYNQFWTDRNTGPIVTPFGVVGALTGSKLQQARASFQMPGTLDARLQTVLSVDGSEMTTGRLGTFRRASAYMSNEYQLVRSFSLIGVGGWETLSDKQIPFLNGRGPIWDAGGRWEPNVDSSILVLYGRSELSDHFSADAEWQITPLTSFVARYMDGIGNAQSSLLAGLGGLGGGFGSGFGNFPVLPPIINTPSGPIMVPPNLVGVPLLNFPPNGLTQQNNVYRTKMLTAELSTMFEDHPIRLSVIRTMRTSLTNIGPREDSTTAVYLATSEPITPDITANARLGFATNSVSNANTYNLSVNANYHFTQTLDGSLGYDFVLRDSAIKALGFTSNAITLRLRKAIQS